MTDSILRSYYNVSSSTFVPFAFVDQWTGPTDQLTHRWPLASDSVDVVGALNGTDGSGVSYSASTGPNANGCVVVADTTNGYIDLGGDVFGTNAITSSNFTVGCWIKAPLDDTFAGAGTSPRMFHLGETGGSNNLEWLFDVTAVPGTFFFGKFDGSYVFASASTANVWLHFCVVVTSGDLSTAVAYVNGSVSGTPYTSASGLGYTAGSAIGNRPDHQRPVGGSLAQLVTYTKALSGSEVTQLYNAF